jgi:tetratricopeptide (TPR) repeat protein
MGADHIALIRHGLALHEAGRYAAALSYFERAFEVAPRCPTAWYNRANTLHMLGRTEEAEAFLRPILAASLDELREGCPDCMPRSLQLDAFMLLSWVLWAGHGPCAEAVELAAEHLRRRQRGVHSLWSAREVRAEIAAMQRELRVGPRTVGAPRLAPSRRPRGLNKGMIPPRAGNGTLLAHPHLISRLD